MQRSEIVGAWRLVSSTARDGKGRERQAAGSHPTGLILYTPDGFMSASIAYEGRARFAGDDVRSGTAEECKAAYDTYLTYAGRWEIEGEFLLHHVEVALFPNMVGSTQRRHARLDGHRLTLSPPPRPGRDGEWVTEVVWEKAS